MWNHRTRHATVKTAEKENFDIDDRKYQYFYCIQIPSFPDQVIMVDKWGAMARHSKQTIFSILKQKS